MVTPSRFVLNVPDSVLDDLRMRLERARWPDEAPDGAPWQYGTDLRYVQDLVAYWQHGFDWRAQEARLNTFKQYTAPVAGIDLHFIHEPGIGPKPLPLVLSHGWPGSVWEFHKLIPMLTDPVHFGGDAADAFTIARQHQGWLFAR
jgi:microsomal epoxide hydrolase